MWVGLRALLGIGLVAAVGLGIGLATIDHWFLSALHPGAFDPSATPPAPDYEDRAAWAAWPGVPSGADAVIPSLPAALPEKAPASTFYLHPTTHVSTSWNAPIDDPAIMEATERGGTLIQASVFNGMSAVYAPRYRQTHGIAWIHPSPDGDKAIDVAYADVEAAFAAFLADIGDRPFFIAGHSQGSALGGRLVRERIAGTPLLDRLIAAYLPGTNLRADDVGIPVCASRAQSGCVVAWNARGPGHTPGGLEYDAADPDTMKGRICVNPISWAADEELVPAERHRGALFFDTPEPTLQPAFAAARCLDGTLEVTGVGDLERDLPSRVLLWMMGPANYHPVEYQMFYAGIRHNAVVRVMARERSPRGFPPR